MYIKYLTIHINLMRAKQRQKTSSGNKKTTKSQ